MTGSLFPDLNFSPPPRFSSFRKTRRDKENNDRRGRQPTPQKTTVVEEHETSLPHTPLNSHGIRSRRSKSSTKKSLQPSTISTNTKTPQTKNHHRRSSTIRNHEAVHDEPLQVSPHVLPSIRTVVVVAPKTLTEGFELDVEIEDETYTVTVPEGGVEEGQEFEIPHPKDLAALSIEEGHSTRRGRSTHSPEHENDDTSSIALTAKPTEEEDEDATSFYHDQHSYITTSPHGVPSGEDGETTMEEPSEAGTSKVEQGPHNNNKFLERDALGAPYGRWRYPLCACCDVVTQATFWMAFCCVPVLLAQLLTRLKLNWKGQRDTDMEISLSYNKIVLSFLVVVALANVTAVGFVLVLLYLIALLVYTGRNLRKTIRKRYNIPSSLLPEIMDDCCCMLFCCCCTSIQMSRQTHNDKEYPGSCCTPTGLDMDAPEMVV